jgi:hypothetical protein
MDKIILKINNGENDGDVNSITGTSIDRGSVNIGNWALIDSDGIFRFALPISAGTKIKKAILCLYPESFKCFPEQEEKNLKIKKIEISASNEFDAQPLSYGCNRTFIGKKNYYNYNLKLYEFNYFDITSIIQLIIDGEGWKKDNHILLKVQIKREQNKLVKIASADENEFGATELIIDLSAKQVFELNEDFNFSDELILVETKRKYQDEYRLGDMQIFPDRISFSKSILPSIYKIENEKNFELIIELKADFESVSKFLNLVGKRLIFATPDEINNSLVKSCSISYNITYVDLVLNLIII